MHASFAAVCAHLMHMHVRCEYHTRTDAAAVVVERGHLRARCERDSDVIATERRVEWAEWANNPNP